MPSPRTVTDSVTTHLDASISQNGTTDTMTLPQLMPGNRAGHPHAAFLGATGESRQGVIDTCHAQELQDAALELAQLGHEDNRRSLAHSQRMTLHVLEQVDHPAGRGATTFATLGIQRQAGDRLAIHGAAEFTLQQRLGQER